MVEKDKYGSEGKLDEKFLYKYDSKGLIAEMQNYTNGEEAHLHKYIYTYDEQGNMIKFIEEKTGFSETYTYQYDKTGNWVKKIYFKANGKATTIEERRIEYY